MSIPLYFPSLAIHMDLDIQIGGILDKAKNEIVLEIMANWPRI